MAVGGLVLALAWLGGTVLALHAGFPTAAAVVLSVACFGLGLVGRGGTVRLGALALGVAALAVARAGIGATAPVQVDLHGPVVLVGRVGDAPAPLGPRLAFPVDVAALGRPGEAPTSLADGSVPRVLVRAGRADVTVGDVVTVEGRLVRPRSRPGWPEEELLARRGIATIVDAARVRVGEPAGPGVRATLERARRQLDGTIRAALPEPHASLVAGVALGSRGGLPPELREALATTGTSHLVAASGYNVAIVAGVVLAVAVRLVGRPWALAPTLVAAWAYALLVGASPSVVRAALMASFGIGALALGRLSDAPTALALTAALMAAWDPWIIYDLGFQLSALATAGLVLFGTPIAERLRPLPATVRAAVGATLAAELTTLPIVLGTFHALSLVAPLANAAVGPVVPVLTVVGGLLGVLGDLPGPGTALGWTAWAVAAYALAAIEWCARLPVASVATGQLPPWLALGWYAALALVALARSPELTTRLGSLGHVRVGATAGALCLAAAPLLAVPTQDVTTVALLDVGAPAAFVRAPGGRTLVAAAGATPAQLRASVARRLGLWEGGVDVAVALRADDRTRAALAETLDRYPATALVGPSEDGTAGGDAAVGTLIPAEPGLVLELGPGARLLVVDVRADDGRPVVDVALVADSVAIWLPGPGEPSARWADVTPGLPAIVRLPGRSPRWLAAARPAQLRAVVGEGLDQLDRAELGAVPYLGHAIYGAVEIVVATSEVALSVERCSGQVECRTLRMLDDREP